MLKATGTTSLNHTPTRCVSSYGWKLRNKSKARTSRRPKSSNAPRRSKSLKAMKLPHFAARLQNAARDRACFAVHEVGQEVNVPHARPRVPSVGLNRIEQRAEDADQILVRYCTGLIEQDVPVSADVPDQVFD